MKYGLLSKHLRQRKQQHGGSENRKSGMKNQKWCVAVITWSKKHSSKQVVPIANP